MGRYSFLRPVTCDGGGASFLVGRSGLGEVLEVGRLGVAWVLADRVSWGWPELMRTIGTVTVDLSGALLLTQDIHHWEGLQNIAHAHIDT